MKQMQVLRQSVDDGEVDSGMPWRVYLVDDFAFADNDDEVDSAELDVFVDVPAPEEDAVSASQLPDVEGTIAGLDAHAGRAANDDAP